MNSFYARGAKNRYIDIILRSDTFESATQQLYYGIKLNRNLVYPVY
jgi:hypothetical protein